MRLGSLLITTKPLTKMSSSVLLDSNSGDTKDLRNAGLHEIETRFGSQATRGRDVVEQHLSLIHI